MGAGSSRGATRITLLGVDNGGARAIVLLSATQNNQPHKGEKMGKMNEADRAYADLADREGIFCAHFELLKMAEEVAVRGEGTNDMPRSSTIYTFSDGSALGLGDHTDYAGNIFFMQERN